MEGKELIKEIDDLGPRVERLKALYEQYFIGIEKIPPNVLRKEVDRVIWQLRKVRFQNTRLRFKFQQIIQRYNTYQQYWSRTLREIEKGTFKRHIIKAAKRFGAKDALDAAGKRTRMRDVERAVAEEEKPEVKTWDLLDDTPTPASVRAAQQGDEQQHHQGHDPYAAQRAAQGQAYGQQAYGQQGQGNAQQSGGYTAQPQGHPQQAGYPQPPGYQQQQAGYQQQQAGYQQQQAGYPQQAGHPQQGYQQQGYQQQGYPQPGHPQQAGYPPQPHAGRPQQGHPQQGYQQQPRAGYPPPAQKAPRPLPPRRSGNPEQRPTTPAPAEQRPTNPAPARPTGPAVSPPPVRQPPAPPGPEARRAPPPPPRRRPPPPKRSAEDERAKRLYNQYVEAKHRTGESIAGLTYEKLKKSLDSQTAKLRKKHGAGKSIDYEVVEKNGRAVLRPKVK